jgi:hypothetical protein
MRRFVANGYLDVETVASPQSITKTEELVGFSDAMEFRGGISAPTLKPLQQAPRLLNNGLRVIHGPYVRKPFAIQTKEVVQRVLDTLGGRHLPDATRGWEIYCGRHDVYRGYTCGEPAHKSDHFLVPFHCDATDGTEELNPLRKLDVREVAGGEAAKVSFDDPPIFLFIQFAVFHDLISAKAC